MAKRGRIRPQACIPRITLNLLKVWRIKMSEPLAFHFAATHRSDTGKQAARSLRRAKKVPGIVYGADETPETITLELKDLMKALSQEAVYSHILTLTVDGKPQKVVLKALSRHHIKPEVTHVDFLRIKAGEAITMRVPLHFIGENDCPGVKDEGGVVSHLMKEIEITCLPENLPEFIEIDLSGAKLDDAVHLSDIKLPKGVELSEELTEDHNPTIISIHRPRVEKEPEVEAETADATETERTDEEATTRDENPAGEE